MSISHALQFLALALMAVCCVNQQHQVFFRHHRLFGHDSQVRAVYLLALSELQEIMSQPRKFVPGMLALLLVAGVCAYYGWVVFAVGLCLIYPVHLFAMGQLARWRLAQL